MRCSSLSEIKMEKILWIEEYLEEAVRLAHEEGTEPALKLLDRLLYEEPGYARLHYVLGRVYDQAEDPQKAERHLRLSIYFDATLAEPYNLLGSILYDQQRLDEAIVIYRKGLKAKQAQKAWLLSEVGRAFELKRKYRKAISHYREALRCSAELRNCTVLEASIKRCKRKLK
jgi:tetratricopeptide (TPR) repeat protein